MEIAAIGKFSSSGGVQKFIPDDVLLDAHPPALLSTKHVGSADLVSLGHVGMGQVISRCVVRVSN